MPVVSTEYQIICANLRKDMSAKMWEVALNLVLDRMGRLRVPTIVGIQEAYTARNARILKRVCEKRGLAYLGLKQDSTLIYNPKYLKAHYSHLYKVKKSRRLLVSPTRCSLFANFENLIVPGELVGVLVNHRMNGVYTADAPLKFFSWRKRAWVNHRTLDKTLVENGSHATLDGRRRHVPLVCMGDENAHPPKFHGNPFERTRLAMHHVSDYMAISDAELIPNHEMSTSHERTFHDHSDHLGLEMKVSIKHAIKA